MRCSCLLQTTSTCHKDVSTTPCVEVMTGRSNAGCSSPKMEYLLHAVVYPCPFEEVQNSAAGHKGACRLERIRGMDI